MNIGSSAAVGNNHSFPKVTKWDFPEEIEFVGLQVWQSSTAFHSLEVIYLDKDCIKTALAKKTKEEEAKKK